MKKLYSLFAAVVMAVVVNAQGTENFDSRSNTTGTLYTSASFTGADNTSWALATARVINTAADYNISNVSVILNANGTATITFPNGVGTLQYQYRKAFTGSGSRSLQVSVDGTAVSSTAAFGSGSGAQATVYTHLVNINKTGSVVVEVKALTNQVTIDNFTWTAPGTLAVSDLNASKTKFVKATAVRSTLDFGMKANVQIYSANGQLIKTTSVNEGTALDVSSLPKGVYIVRGDANGTVVSEKIVKK